MARNLSPVFKLQGTIRGLTFVDSKSYGAHVRAARGTHKPAVCNEALKRNYNRTSILNAAASPVHRALKQWGGAFAQRNLWARMLSRMRKSYSDDTGALLQMLQGLEVNESYPISRFGVHPSAVVKSGSRKMEVLVQVRGEPLFARKLKADCYYYELAVIWIHGTGHYTIDLMETEWLLLDEGVTYHVFGFKKPKGALYCVCCLKLQGGAGHHALEVFPAMGMQVVAGGVV